MFLAVICVSMFRAVITHFSVSVTNDKIVRKKNLLAVQEDIHAVQMPVLVGFNSLEGLFERTAVNPADRHNDPAKYLAELLWRTQTQATKEEAAENAAKIIKVYQDNLAAIECVGDIYLEMIETDIKYLVGIIHLATNLAGKMYPENVYLYQFGAYLKKKNIWNPYDGKYYPGAAHCDELDIIFKLSEAADENIDFRKNALVKHLTGIWAQFVKTGNPNPTDVVDTWRPIGERLTHCYEIRVTSSIYREFTSFEKLRFKLWGDAYGIDFLSAQIKKPAVTAVDDALCKLFEKNVLDESKHQHQHSVAQTYAVVPKIKPHHKVSARTSKGTIQGDLCLYDEHYHSFQHVPYAQVPVGNLRFAAPKDIVSFDDVKKSLKLDEFGRYGLEDQLFLHIYTPEISPGSTSGNMPVIVFVPGEMTAEAERYRSEDLYGPQFLLAQNVVLVVLSYRRGILGFTAFREANAELDVPIDAGIQDIMLGFRFVKNEIRNFGGCPDNITAYGQGTGATHVRRIAAKHGRDNLFHKMILSSSMEHATGIELPMNRYNVRHLVKTDLNEEDCKEDKACIEFLRKMPIDELLSRDAPLFKLPRKYRMLRVKHLQSLLTLTYEATMPVMIGYNSKEGVIEQMIATNNDDDDVYDQTPEGESADQQQLCDNRRRETERDERIKEFYAKQAPAANYRTKYMLTDYCYIVGTIALAQHFAAAMAPKRVYLYRFSVDCDYNFTKNLYGCNVLQDTTVHADELGYIFKTPFTRFVERDSQGDLTIKRMTMLWAQFARTGSPNMKYHNYRMFKTQWRPFERTIYNSCFHIRNRTASQIMLRRWEMKRFKFWESVIGLNFYSKTIPGNKTDDLKNDPEDNPEDDPENESIDTIAEHDQDNQTQ